MPKRTNHRRAIRFQLSDILFRSILFLSVLQFSPVSGKLAVIQTLSALIILVRAR
jgi:hypothetical protein